MAIKSYAEFQEYFIRILTENISFVTGNTEQSDSENAPHGTFWELPYEQFVNGNVPGVVDPETGNKLPILVKGDAAHSNFILSLHGAPGTVFDPNTGSVGRMPADGPPFLTDEQIKPMADWIDAGCPE